MQRLKQNRTTLIIYCTKLVALAALLLFAVLFSVGKNMASATSLDDLNKQQQSEKDDLSDLKKEKKKLEASLEGLDSKMLELSNQMAELEESIGALEDEILLTGEQLETAQADLEHQYESMKLRIQFLYENGSVVSLADLFSAGSFADALALVEYAMDIAAADRALFERFVDTRESVLAKQKLLQEKREELATRQEELKKQEEELLATITDTTQSLAWTNKQVEEKKQSMDELAEQIAAMEEYERKLEEERIRREEEEARKAAEEKARLEAEERARREAEEKAKREAEEQARREAEEQALREAEEQALREQQGNLGSNAGETNGDANTSDVLPVTDAELELLAALVYCEAGGESYEMQLAVASVVVNRMYHPNYEDTLVGVIYQRGQFSPAASGKLALVLERNLASESCRKAAREALSGNTSGDWLRFRFDNGQIEGTVIDGVVFY